MKAEKGKIIAVWGSPASGKSTFAVKLATAIYDNFESTVIVLFTDLETPMIPVIFPNDKPEDNGSVGVPLSKTDIEKEEIIKNLVTVKSRQNFGFIGYKDGENKFTYPRFGRAKAEELLARLSELADYVIVDCVSSLESNPLASTAVELADQIIRLASPDLRSISYYLSQLPLYVDSKYQSEKQIQGLNTPNADVFMPIEEAKSHLKDLAFTLPYSRQVKEQAQKGTLYEKTTDKKFQSRITEIARKVVEYVALCSTADRAALRMLKDHPQLKQVYLCLDHDSAGIEGAYRIADSIHSLGEYQVYRLFPAHKDWDEDLKARMGKDAIPAGEHPKLAYITEKTAELKEMCLEDTDEYIKYKRMPADLFDDTMRKLERLKKQIIASDLTEKKESCAAEMAKTAVAFCVLRSRQIGKPVTAEALADQMAKMYKPHRDKQNISSQLDSIGYDLKEIREDADKSDAQTKTEIEWQIRRTLLLGLSCLQLGGSISLSPTVAEPTVGQAISY